jgi:hypothetical protein
MLVRRRIYKIHKATPAVLERGTGSHRIVGRSISQKAKFRGTIGRSAGFVLYRFNGTERWVVLWFSFGVRLSREMLFDIVPGSADLIPN